MGSDNSSTSFRAIFVDAFGGEKLASPFNPLEFPAYFFFFFHCGAARKLGKIALPNFEVMSRRNETNDDVARARPSKSVRTDLRADKSTETDQYQVGNTYGEKHLRG